MKSLSIVERVNSGLSLYDLFPGNVRIICDFQSSQRDAGIKTSWLVLVKVFEVDASLSQANVIQA